MVLIESKFSRNNLNSQRNQTESQKNSSSDSESGNDGQATINLYGLENQVRIQILSPKGKSKVSNSICCVVDVSGSMGSRAVTKQSGGNSELGYSVLDIVKHSLNTIVQNLDEGDEFSMVTFSDNSKLVCNYQQMTESNIKSSVDLINQCQPDASTNIWAGIEQGLEQMQNDSNKNKNQQLIVLTDGQPNVNPPRGILTTLNNFYNKNIISPKPSINTFGFGYYLDSHLLFNIAQDCQGIYSFIPDSSFVGTIFTNSIASMQSTFATNAVLVFKPLNKNAQLNLSQIKSNFKTYLNKEGEYIVELGNLFFDQSKDIIFQQDLHSELLRDFSVEVKYYTKDTNNFQLSHRMHKAEQIHNANKLEFEQEALRLEVVKTVQQCKDSSQKSQKLVEDTINLLKASQFREDEYIQNLCKDMEDQVKQAVSRDDYFTKWGCHYLPSLAMAHNHKICTNFKDPGVQGYGGNLFNKQRDQIEKIVMSIDPPKPSYRSSGNVQINSALYTSYYYDPNNPCFEGNSEVKMANGTIKKVKEIKKGDEVFCPNTGKAEKVKCVIETEVKENLTQLVRLGKGLLITPYHPVRIQGKWLFPTDIAPTKMAQCSSVYSFLLESGHSMMINDIECVTFAHGFQEDKVKHEYFGTNKVSRDLMWMKGYFKGHVKLQNSPSIRDQATGLVVGLRSNRQWISKIQDLKYSSLSNIKQMSLNKLLQISKKLIKI
ncbi:von willebrand factor type A (vWA) domain was originally protein (macronuclear) [Tetrahymena thermophila SB210]|uniref:von willebrand factor type A (VWA) domain was originally protein n=1 Tax=Tetrahymena thermophila (strain SB210) TaxID=312017 RepID=Q237Q6_TETTS|nr:von willebrand factor type A (vWA) domain was originally protein [Tetrahymena thermophila SB210]EAR92685.1 von willebrand factor type A (vWA) domain was originally protein [Tetrahymena thermophila SB210]|eukprot:XP_001012930.1 von willebrand factor type A (vWA) domain was originally protein [Tetrahymena thermophila SB210]